ncbi:hypothetical protein ACT3R8_11550 [Halomonas sp. AOP42-C2-23]|uniref:hypothetical protein n=1 Tax=Halomonas sp. AOP42-C2-23 TaxID=3457669 RepID=UPI004033625C
MRNHSDIFPFDVAAFEATSKAHTTARTAADALQIAAEYLRRREPLPPILGDYLADAFETAAAKPLDNQGAVLLRELGMKAENRRPSHIIPFDVALFVDNKNNGKSERQRIIAAAKKFDVSETTVRRLLTTGRQDVEEEAREQALFNIEEMEKIAKNPPSK